MSKTAAQLEVAMDNGEFYEFVVESDNFEDARGELKDLLEGSFDSDTFYEIEDDLIDTNDAHIAVIGHDGGVIGSGWIRA